MRSEAERAADRRAYLRKALWLWGYKAVHGCTDCGEHDVRCLDFDHVDPSLKNVPARGWAELSWARLQEETDKCTVRCANCHRKRTSVQQSWLIGQDG